MTGAVDELRWVTPAGWAEQVLTDEHALESDHAHLERAAAANAMSLVRRWPEVARAQPPGARIHGGVAA